MFKIKNIEYIQLSKKPEVIRLSKGGYVIPLPYIPYKFNQEYMIINEFFNTIEWNLIKFINFVIFHFRRPNSSFGMFETGIKKSIHDFTDMDGYANFLSSLKCSLQLKKFSLHLHISKSLNKDMKHV